MATRRGGPAVIGEIQLWDCGALAHQAEACLHVCYPPAALWSGELWSALSCPVPSFPVPCESPSGSQTRGNSLLDSGLNTSSCKRLDSLCVSRIPRSYKTSNQRPASGQAGVHLGGKSPLARGQGQHLVRQESPSEGKAPLARGRGQRRGWPCGSSFTHALVHSFIHSTSLCGCRGPGLVLQRCFAESLRWHRSHPNVRLPGTRNRNLRVPFGTNNFFF